MGTPNTSAIAAGIAALLEGLTYQDAPLYTLVKVGAVQDPTDVIRYAAITMESRKTERFDSGWKVNSTPVLLVESGVDMTDATLAENTVMDIGDMLTSLFVARLSLGGVPGVYVTLVDQDDKAMYKLYPNGRIYRVHQCYVKAIQQYNVVVTG
jgi:hypothetical protein